jgi:hypothetical protein
VSSAAIRVASDPALAVVVRIFVGGVAERWGVPEAALDDLRLVASELFAGAVEAGAGDDVSFTLTSDGDRVSLQTAADALGSGGPSEVGGWGSRLDLIRALFPDADVTDSVRVSVPAGAADPSLTGGR